jgi:hypothetical protein
MLVSIRAAAQLFGTQPTEGAVRAALVAHSEEAQHDAFMQAKFPQVIRASMNANAIRQKMVDFDRRAREDPRSIPGSAKAVAVPPASASSTSSTTDLPGFNGAPASSKPGEVRAPGRSMFTRI